MFSILTNIQFNNKQLQHSNKTTLHLLNDESKQQQNVNVIKEDRCQERIALYHTSKLSFHDDEAYYSLNFDQLLSLIKKNHSYLDNTTRQQALQNTAPIGVNHDNPSRNGLCTIRIKRRQVASSTNKNSRWQYAVSICLEDDLSDTDSIQLTEASSTSESSSKRITRSKKWHTWLSTQQLHLNSNNCIQQHFMWYIQSSVHSPSSSSSSSSEVSSQSRDDSKKSTDGIIVQLPSGSEADINLFVKSLYKSLDIFVSSNHHQEDAIQMYTLGSDHSMQTHEGLETLSRKLAPLPCSNNFTTTNITWPQVEQRLLKHRNVALLTCSTLTENYSPVPNCMHSIYKVVGTCRDKLTLDKPQILLATTDISHDIDRLVWMKLDRSVVHNSSLLRLGWIFFRSFAHRIAKASGGYFLQRKTQLINQNVESCHKTEIRPPKATDASNIPYPMESSDKHAKALATQQSQVAHVLSPKNAFTELMRSSSTQTSGSKKLKTAHKRQKVMKSSNKALQFGMFEISTPIDHAETQAASLPILAQYLLRAKSLSEKYNEPMPDIDCRRDEIIAAYSKQSWPAPIIYLDHVCLVISDMYPKAKHHWLIMGRKWDVESKDKENSNQIHTIPASARSLSKRHLRGLKHMKNVAQIIVHACTESSSKLIRGLPRQHNAHHIGTGEGVLCHHAVSLKPNQLFRCGFHTVPSISPFHMHVISQDFVSDSLKSSRHYLTFTSSFFVDCDDVIDVFEASDTMDKNFHWMDYDSAESIVKLRPSKNTPLRCHLDGQEFVRIGLLKEHLLKLSPQPQFTGTFLERDSS